LPMELRLRDGRGEGDWWGADGDMGLLESRDPEINKEMGEGLRACNGVRERNQDIECGKEKEELRGEGWGKREHETNKKEQE
jgi:hypothetical protein